MIKGDSVCGAAYFGSDTLFLATNEKDPSHICKATMAYLSELSQAVINKEDEAKIEYIINANREKISEEIKTSIIKANIDCEEIYNYGHSKSVTVTILSGLEEKYLAFNINGEAQAVKKEQLNNFDEIYKKIEKAEILGEKDLKAIFTLSFEKNWLINPKKVFKDILSPNFKKNLIRDFDKITDSITTEDDSKSLPQEWIRAMSSSIQFIDGKESDEIDVHAELKMLTKIEKTSGEQENKIGVSKACCAKCMCMINAVNEIVPELNIKVTGSHSGIFPAGIPPLEEMQNITHEQKEQIKAKILLLAEGLKSSYPSSSGPIETIQDFYHKFYDKTTHNAKEKHTKSPSPARANGLKNMNDILIREFGPEKVSTIAFPTFVGTEADNTSLSDSLSSLHLSDSLSSLRSSDNTSISSDMSIYGSKDSTPESINKSVSTKYRDLEELRSNKNNTNKSNQL